MHTIKLFFGKKEFFGLKIACYIRVGLAMRNESIVLGSFEFGGHKIIAEFKITYRWICRGSSNILQSQLHGIFGHIKIVILNKLLKKLTSLFTFAWYRCLGGAIVVKYGAFATVGALALGVWGLMREKHRRCGGQREQTSSDLITFFKAMGASLLLGIYNSVICRRTVTKNRRLLAYDILRFRHRACKRGHHGLHYAGTVELFSELLTHLA